MIPHRAGIPKSKLSGYEKWEAPGPAEWCARGYAVVNVDARGVFDSEGDIRYVDRLEPIFYIGLIRTDGMQMARNRRRPG